MPTMKDVARKAEVSIKTVSRVINNEVGVSEETREKIRKAMRERDLKKSVEERMDEIRSEPGSFLFKMAEHPNNEGMWKILEGFMRRRDPKTIQHK